MNYPLDVDVDVLLKAGGLKRREFALVERTEAEVPLFAAIGSGLLDQNVVFSKRIEEPVDRLGPLDAVEAGVDSPVEVLEGGDGRMLARVLFEGLGIVVAFLPEVRDELIAGGDELGELDGGVGSCQRLAERDLRGVDGETRDDGHRAPSPWCSTAAGGVVVVVVSVRTTSVMRDTDMMVSHRMSVTYSGAGTPHNPASA